MSTNTNTTNLKQNESFGQILVRKLTSRKFWVSVATMVFLIMVYLGADQKETTQIVAIIMAGATAIGYLLGEGLADAGKLTEGEVIVDGVGYPQFSEVNNEDKET